MPEAPDIENGVLTTTKSDGTGIGCCGRCCEEFKMSFFQLEEPSGRMLDLERSFSSEPRSFLVIVGKSILWSLTIYSLVKSVLVSEHPRFWLAFLTHWSLLHAVFYMTVSYILSFGVNPRWLLKCAWLSFSVAAVHQILVTLLFWTLDYEPEKNPLNDLVFLVHGGLMVVVLFDGLVVNRVPVRLKHTIVTMAFALLYLTWSILHNTVYQYNPHTADDDVADDDAIYEVMKWSKEPLSAAIVASVVVFVLLPFFSVIIWALSLISRRYEESVQPESNEKDVDLSLISRHYDELEQTESNENDVEMVEGLLPEEETGRTSLSADL
jgi:hypothetical protein